MQGGLFGLSTSQKAYLFLCQLTPCIITTIALYQTGDYLIPSILIQIFYILSSLIYIRYFSKQGEIAPYTMNELRRVDFQLMKGLHLGISAFLLITLYSMIAIHFGRVHLPKRLDIGKVSSQYWYLYLPIMVLNPILEEWFWRLFLPKTMNLTYIKMQELNVAYLLFHFSLFTNLLGFWKAIMFVGIFFSIGRSMSHIKEKFGIISAIITHYGITLAGFVMYMLIKHVYE